MWTGARGMGGAECGPGARGMGGAECGPGARGTGGASVDQGLGVREVLLQRTMTGSWRCSCSF